MSSHADNRVDKDYIKSKLGIAETAANSATETFKQVSLKSNVLEEIEATRNLMYEARNYFGELALTICNRIKRERQDEYDERCSVYDSGSGEDQEQVRRAGFDLRSCN